MNIVPRLHECHSFHYEKKSNCVLNITIPRFSNYVKYDGSEFTDYKTDDSHFKVFFRPVFYANGDCRENEGYVSIQFHGVEAVLLNRSWIEFNCTVAVIDVAGCKRFLKSLAYVYHSNSFRDSQNGYLKFGLSKYLKREILCNDSSQLLPRDCLTIHIEVQYHVHVYNMNLETSSNLVQGIFASDEEKFYIRLDSSFGQKLRKVCDFFQCASDSSMIEHKTRHVHVPLEEMKPFFLIFLIFRGDKEIVIESIEDIYQMYIVAYKYNFETVIETCRQFIKSFLCQIKDSKVYEHTVESVPRISKLAKKYRDESLKEMVAVYSENKNNFESDQHAFQESIKKKLNTDWSCEFGLISGMWDSFKLSKISNDDEKPDLEFYK